MVGIVVEDDIIVTPVPIPPDREPEPCAVERCPCPEPERRDHGRLQTKRKGEAFR